MNCSKIVLPCLLLVFVTSIHGQPPGDSKSSMEQMIREYTADSQTLNHRFQVALDEEATKIRELVAEQWLDRLKASEFFALERDEQLDTILLRNKLEYLIVRRRLDHERDVQVASEFLPFARELVQFCKDRENVIAIDSRALAGQLDSAAKHIEDEAKRLEKSKPVDRKQRWSALRAVELLESLHRSVVEADLFYAGYDPNYTWWCKKPMERLQKATTNHVQFLREKIVGVSESDKDTIIGMPIGAEGIALELKHEWIAHTPEELIELANREMAWCDDQIRQAAHELGCGEDWRQALELVKAKHVEPGKQPELIRNLAFEAIEFLQERDLLTIPPLAASGWRMTMMSPERQRVSPYFLGGDTIIVSYPTDAMSHEEKLMSMRSNNEHFARATVHHELIPGHGLQFYMLARHRPYRELFSTPFWMEGWALYWEMLLWDLDFARGPEDRVGMLFWRRHRCARIVFSLGYHLGKLSPEQCIDYLVDQVGHERAAAAAEVRRSIMGNYGPLYQAAYMLGGMQLRALHQELVGTGRMTDKMFHDSVLQEHSIPIEPLREYLSGNALRPDATSQWRFADGNRK